MMMSSRGEVKKMQQKGYREGMRSREDRFYTRHSIL